MERPVGTKRNVFPRWRALGRTSSIELKSTSGEAPVIAADAIRAQVRALYTRWRDNPTLEAAAEVVDSAVLLRDPLAVGPARAILAHPGAMPAVKRVAKFIVDGTNVPLDEADRTCEARDRLIGRIRLLKQRLRDEPRNALAWLEKSRLQTLVGNTERAQEDLTTALRCAPESRLLLRAYARLMVHMNRPQVGHERLVRSERLAYDPWIQAAEIALAQASGRRPESLVLARNVLRESGFAAPHLSELAAAVGTLEAQEGALKLARRHFRQSLQSPTDNALSQAFWVRDILRVDLDIERAQLAIPRAFEARVHAALADKRWHDAVANCKKWICDEPFSLRAALNGSYVASTFLWSPSDALEICLIGLTANPNDVGLLNNKAVSLVRIGKLDDAELVLDDIGARNQHPMLEPFILATRGLLCFARNRYSAGRHYYRRAVEVARKLNNPEIEFRAMTHWIYEDLSAANISQEDAAKIVGVLDALSSKKSLNMTSLDGWTIMKERALAQAGWSTTTDPEIFQILDAFSAL